MKTWLQKAMSIHEQIAKLLSKDRHYLVLELSPKQAEYAEVNPKRIRKAIAELVKGE